MFISIFVLAICSVCILQTLAFIQGLTLERYDVADISWGVGFVLISGISFLVTPVQSLPALIIVCLVSIWGIRLSAHIYKRHKKTKEDNRYVTLRAEWKKYPKLQIYTKIFLLQGFLLMLVAIPILVSIASGHIVEVISLPFILGISIWIAGFSFESIADWQLKNFILNPSNAGKIMDTGLWKYSRHPNYFGEILLWWGIWLTTVQTPLWYVALVGPLVITFLIVKVSGIPLSEKALSGKPGFDAYKEKTSILIPWFTKKIN